MMNIENYWAPLLFLAALNNTYSLLSSQRLDVKCKTIESRDKIAFAFDRFRAQNCNNSEWVFSALKVTKIILLRFWLILQPAPLICSRS